MYTDILEIGQAVTVEYHIPEMNRTLFFEAVILTVDGDFVTVDYDGSTPETVHKSKVHPYDEST